jgi:hypothetical protein
MIGQTLILDDREQSEKLSEKVIFPKEEVEWPNTPVENSQYNMINGDTIGELWKKIKTLAGYIPG